MQGVVKAELYAMGQGRCLGTTFAGSILGSEHAFRFAGHDARVILPSAEFEEGDHAPKGSNAGRIHFRDGLTSDTSPAVSFYEVDYLSLEIDFDKAVRLPTATLDHPKVRLSPALQKAAPHMKALSEKYSDLLTSAWQHWLRVARWATNQPSIGLCTEQSVTEPILGMPRIHEKSSKYAVWARTSITSASQLASIDDEKWRHIQEVLDENHATPIWFEYLVEAQHRLARSDFLGCILSSTISCETIARAVFREHIGTTKNADVEELVERTPAQAIVGRWRGLTGQKAEGKVHKLFELRNKLMHSGRADEIDSQVARNALWTARKFIDDGDRWIFDRRGLTNPREKFDVKSSRQKR